MTANVLPQVILDEIFNLSCRISDVSLTHLYEELEKFGCVVTNSENYDASVIIYFKRAADDDHAALDGELRIDRIHRNFELAARYGEQTIFPVLGNWDLIVACLVELLGSTNDNS